MKLTNNKIYQYGNELSIFANCDIKMPVRINFFLQKNIQIVMALAQEIEMARMNIARQFGVPNEEGTSYSIPQENMAQVQKELNDLFALEQEINLHIFKLDDFNDIELTYQQMSAIMFMIEE